MTFKQKLKHVCPKCKENSIRVYLQNILRVYKLLKPEATEVPETGGWNGVDDHCPENITKRYPPVGIEPPIL